jgi:general secretion pathway protein M
MIPLALTGAAGRALAVLLLVALAGLLWIAAAQPLLDWHADRAETLERKVRTLHRMTALAETLPQWRALWADATSLPASRPALFDGISDPLAAATMQGAVQELARQSGAAINSLEVLAVEPRGSYRRIALRVSAEGSLPVMTELLRRLGDASPAIVVDQLTLQGPGPSTRTQAPPLSASFLAIGFRAGGPATP